MIVYSVTSRPSFDRVEKFRTQVARVKDSDAVPVVLVGNKIDRVHEREVETRHGEQLAQRLGCAFVETSAKTRENLEEAFFTAVRMGGFSPSLSGVKLHSSLLPQGRYSWSKSEVLTGPEPDSQSNDKRAGALPSRSGNRNDPLASAPCYDRLDHPSSLGSVFPHRRRSPTSFPVPRYLMQPPAFSFS